ncbi:hypothetical protein L1987_01281 [Smallanthus sonchifolius]|uniref:Uncharacterized protein n=1 Tax=Smallanthus sonchifolius TaxID=185202 RepID=A0ACB9K4S9_9ASTR|nr:hypothetical protein L1987_01281 [Smallanthus sonchifolius]
MIKHNRSPVVRIRVGRKRLCLSGSGSGDVLGGDTDDVFDFTQCRRGYSCGFMVCLYFMLILSGNLSNKPNPGREQSKHGFKSLFRRSFNKKVYEG